VVTFEKETKLSSMNNPIITLVLTGIAAGASAASAHAQSQSILTTYTANSGDLIAGFTTGTGNDLMLNLGTAGSLQSGQYWDLTTLLGGTIPSNVSSHWATVQWGVIGAGGAFGYTTANTTPANLSTAGLNTVKGTVNGIGGDLLSGIATPASGGSDDSNWYGGTVSGAAGTYETAWINPNANGAGTIDFYRGQNNNTTPTVLNTWTLYTDSGTGDEILLYGTAAPVPEPSIYGIFAGAGLLALSLRRKFARA
jgi:hypothetical protein